jgi:anti-sigma B factor antagonist
MTHLKVEIEKKNHVGIIRLDGLLDAHNAELFSDALNELISGDFTKIVVDFGNLNYLGSSGLEVILSRIQGLRDKGGDIVLVNMAAKIYKVFDLLGLTDFLKFYGSMDEAVSSF